MPLRLHPRLRASILRAIRTTLAALALTLAVAQLLELSKTVPFLRASFLRLLFRLPHFRRFREVGDGREDQCVVHVRRRLAAVGVRPNSTAEPDVVDAVLRGIDDFASDASFLPTMGPVKGRILDAATLRARPRRALVLGAYAAYNALRVVKWLGPGSRVVALEPSVRAAAVAQRMLDLAGLPPDRVALIYGRLADDAQSLLAERLEREHGFNEPGGGVGLVVMGHDPADFLPDLNRILSRAWMHPRSVVVADSVMLPPAADFRAFVKQRADLFASVEHRSKLAYQGVVPDVVLEAEYVGASSLPVAQQTAQQTTQHDAGSGGGGGGLGGGKVPSLRRAPTPTAPPLPDSVGDDVSSTGSAPGPGDDHVTEPRKPVAKAPLPPRN